MRSSATAEDLPDASFAGQQETYLNVRGLDDVLEQVRSCYTSFKSSKIIVFSPKANMNSIFPIT